MNSERSFFLILDFQFRSFVDHKPVELRKSYKYIFLEKPKQRYMKAKLKLWLHFINKIIMRPSPNYGGMTPILLIHKSLKLISAIRNSIFAIIQKNCDRNPMKCEFFYNPEWIFLIFKPRLPA